MVEIDDAGIAVDVCPSCGGLWLDAGELERKGAKLPPGGVDYGGDRRCPRCDRRMRVRPSKVAELDVCPKCNGMFLDAGEIELLVDRPPLPTQVVAPPLPRPKRR
jgi:Zn-finger nucleic acid-binding protein